MIAAIAINIVMVLLALGIGGGIFPARVFSGMIGVLHKTIGITLPSPEQERMVAAIWIASMIVIGDGMFSCCSSLLVPSSKVDERIVSKFRAVLS
jgi:hypothetical protein